MIRLCVEFHCSVSFAVWSVHNPPVLVFSCPVRLWGLGHWLEPNQNAPISTIFTLFHPSVMYCQFFQTNPVGLSLEHVLTLIPYFLSKVDITNPPSRKDIFSRHDVRGMHRNAFHSLPNTCGKLFKYKSLFSKRRQHNFPYNCWSFFALRLSRMPSFSIKFV